MVSEWARDRIPAALGHTHIRMLEEPTVACWGCNGCEHGVRRKGLPGGGAVLHWEEVSCVSVDRGFLFSVLSSLEAI